MVPGDLKGRDLLTMGELKQDEVYRLLSRALEMKRQHKARVCERLLEDKTIALVFRKPSARTRVSFEVAAWQLGAHPVMLKDDELKIGQREPVADVARVLSGYVDAIVVRTFDHREVEEIAAYGSVPVINGLSDGFHPCQALADLMTILEKKDRLAGVTLAYIGDGNNVCHSLLLAAGTLGMNMMVASPRGYEPKAEVVRAAQQAMRGVAQRIKVVNDPAQAVEDADVVYTDVWASMGQEQDEAKRIRDFAGFQVNRELLAGARRGAIVMHCLPAHREQEITAEVLEGARSVVFEQAENRLHTAKALLAMVV